MPNDASTTAARATEALAPRLLSEVNWLVPEGQRNIDGMQAARMLADLLANAFLAAMMKEAASHTMTWLLARLGKFFEPAASPPADLTEAAKQGSNMLAALPPADRPAAMKDAHAELVAALVKMMPAANAERIAKAVQDSLAHHAGG